VRAFAGQSGNKGSKFWPFIPRDFYPVGRVVVIVVYFQLISLKNSPSPRFSRFCFRRRNTVISWYQLHIFPSTGQQRPCNMNQSELGPKKKSLKIPASVAK
jgi:hypothetical protein